MTGEINKDFYCSADSYFFDGRGKPKCIESVIDLSTGTLKYTDCYNRCRNRHRKWPTPEQFEKKYGRKLKNGDAMYAFSDEQNDWYATEFPYYQQSNKLYVCACTPFGKPPDDWRPE